jgi:transcriptional regulator GlxA family with amidase domain
MGEVECARRLVVLAGAAVGCLLWANEGLLRGRTGTAHFAASSGVEGWWVLR